MQLGHSSILLLLLQLLLTLPLLYNLQIYLKIIKVRPGPQKAHFPAFRGSMSFLSPNKYCQNSEGYLGGKQSNQHIHIPLVHCALCWCLQHPVQHQPAGHPSLHVQSSTSHQSAVQCRRHHYLEHPPSLNKTVSMYYLLPA